MVQLYTEDHLGPEEVGHDFRGMQVKLLHAKDRALFFADSVG